MYLGDIKLREWISHHRGGGAGGISHLPPFLFVLRQHEEGHECYFWRMDKSCFISFREARRAEPGLWAWVPAAVSYFPPLLRRVLPGPVRCRVARGISGPGDPPAPEEGGSGRGLRKSAQGCSSSSQAREREPVSRAARLFHELSPGLCADTPMACRRQGDRQPKKGRRQGGQEYQICDIFPQGKEAVSSVLINLVLSPFKRNARGRADLS